jgi:hypothetical protein
MKFVTVATSPIPRLKLLESSCRYHGIPLIVLADGRPYIGHGCKVKYLVEYLKTVDPTELVLYLDAYDTFFLTGPEEIEEKFRRFDHPMVFSAEQNCSIDGEPMLRFNGWRRYPRYQKPYRFINARSVVGEAQYMLEVLERADIPPEAKDDQTLFHLFFVENPSAFRLDDRHEIFTCTSGRTGLEHEDYTVEGDRLRNRITGSLPCIVHCPGKNYLGLEELAAKLPFEGEPYEPSPSEIATHRRSRSWNTATARTLADNYLFHLLLQSAGVLFALIASMGLLGSLLR